MLTASHYETLKILKQELNRRLEWDKHVIDLYSDLSNDCEFSEQIGQLFLSILVKDEYDLGVAECITSGIK